MQKDILAKLLATENITVVHENAPTASFNVKDRVLTLPLWEGLTGDNYDHFIGHEVGHALYTPEDGWHDAVCDRGRAYKSFLNVIEDARIERLVQRKYPGLRRNFINSYKKLMADGFFGANLDEINEFDLIDRINTYFKLGASCGVRIEKDELCWIKEIEECVTWEEVVDIADRLFAQEKAKKEEQQQQQQDMADEGQTETEQGMSDGMSDSDWEMESDDETEQEGEGSESEEFDSGEDADEEEDEFDPTDEESEGEEEDSDIDPTDPISRTEESLHDNIRKEFNSDENVSVYNLKMSGKDVKPLIIDHKAVYEMGYTQTRRWVGGDYVIAKEHIGMYGEKLWKEFQVNNKNSVNYMVKEFEIKKKASEYARTTLSKTGVICPVKMNDYKFSDDIFRKMAVTPEGKNHGMVMYVDWSGSMHHHVKPTIDQVLNLVMFCRQVNIPYRVYLFSDQYFKMADVVEKDVNTLAYRDGFRLLEIFNNKMNRASFTKMAQMMLSIGQAFAKDVCYEVPYDLYLGGTPLDDAIMAAIQIHDEFKKSNRLDIVNTVFLTDGDSHTIECVVRTKSGASSNQVPGDYLINRNNVVKVLDPVSKKQYRVPYARAAYTKVLLNIFKERTGSNAIGYRIVGMNRRNLYSDLRGLGLSGEQIDRAANTLKKERFVSIPNIGYSKFFVVVGGKNLETANTTLEVKQDASKGQIRTAFKKANGNRKQTRLLLSQFIDMVA